MWLPNVAPAVPNGTVPGHAGTWPQDDPRRRSPSDGEDENRARRFREESPGPVRCRDCESGPASVLRSEPGG